MISLEKWSILKSLQKLPKNVRDLGNLIVAKGLKKLPKFKKIAQSGHTSSEWGKWFLSWVVAQLPERSLVASDTWGLRIQCDQIGPFSKGLADKSSWKFSCPFVSI